MTAPDFSFRRTTIVAVLLLSWNVNGLRSVLGKTLPQFVAQHRPDVLCLQEIKCLPEQCPDMSWAEGYSTHWCSAGRKGYSGTLTLSRIPPLRASCGIGLPNIDDEGRAAVTRFSGFTLVNVYTPNSKRDLSRLSERTEIWDPAFRNYLQRLARRGPVVTCGDFNVAHQPIDLSHPKRNERTHGFTIEEREQFSRLIDAGFIDTFREFESGPGHYTWWSQMSGARARNVGWRIDYFLISPKLRPKLKRAFILPEVMGSDHCPVGIELDV